MSLKNLLYTNSNPNPENICERCLSLIGTVWVPGTEPYLPMHPRCYCAYYPTDLTPEQGRQPPAIEEMDPATRWSWILYVVYLLIIGAKISPWLAPLIPEALREKEKQPSKPQQPHEENTMPPDLPPELLAPVLRQATGRVFLSNELPGARIYRCSFMAAGRVKRADQSLSDWLIPPAAIQAAESMFSGAPCYLDHPELYGFGMGLQPMHQEPKVANLVGITTEAHWSPEEQTMLGSLRLYDRAEGSPGWFVGLLFDQILEDKAAGRPTPPVGLSAVFFHESHLDETSGLRLTDHIQHVESVDIVYDPGAAGYIRAALSATRPATFTVPSWTGDASRQPDPARSLSAVRPSTFAVSGIRHLSPQGGLSMPPEEITVQEAPTTPAPAPATPPAPAQTSSQPATTPAPETPPANADRGATSADQLSEALRQIEQMGAQVQHLTSLLARQQEGQAITGMELPNAVGAPADLRIRGMLSSLDRVEQALDAMLDGIRPEAGVHPLSGIRELYTLLSGDFEMTGRYNPDRVYLANVTSSTMAALVANALNKRVMNEYQTYPKWWEPGVTEQDFANLQDVRWITLGGIGELSTVVEGQAYSELTWDDNTETASFVKKGGYLGITIEAIDKDDTRRLRSAPRALAQSAWLTLGKTIAALFTANSGYGPAMADTNYMFDSSNHGNLGTSAFSHTAWVATKLAMQKVTELNSSERLGALLKPRFVWVPVDLEESAVAELASGEGQIGSADYNINADAYADSLTSRLQRAKARVIVVPFWTDTADWVAQADPRLYPGLGLGYRYGRTPEIFSVASPTAGLMFTNDTMPVKVRFFFATGFTDYRAFYKHLVS